jgi:phage terminase large subunit-like protein
LDTSSKFEAISSEDHSLDGYNISGALIDELHAHRDRSVWDVLETATGSRLQPIVWAITTAGTNRAGICYQQHLHVRDILTGRVVDESYFGCIWTIDEGDDPFAESSMRKANPNWGVSIFPENFRQIAARAQSMPSAQTAYFTKHLCLWSNSDHQWLPNGSWEKCADTSLLIDAFAGEDCYVGIDLAQRADLAAMAFLFPPAGDRLKWTVFCKFYLPQETVERAENSHFQGWERLGRLTVTDGAVIDYDAILDDLEAACERFDVREIASDPWQNVPFMSSLEKRGVRVPRVDVRPTIATLSPVMKELEGFIISGKIQHDNDPILGWCFSNVVAKTDSRDNIQPIKEAPERKIDGVVATMIAMDRALRALTTPDFEKRGLWSV